MTGDNSAPDPKVEGTVKELGGSEKSSRGNNTPEGIEFASDNHDDSASSGGTKPTLHVVKQVLEFDENVVMDVTTTDEDEELPESPSVEDRDAEAGAEQITNEAADVAGGNMTPASVVEVVLRTYELGMSMEGMPYAVPKTPGAARVAVPVKSLKGKLLSALFDKGVSVSKDGVSQALDVVEAKASMVEPDELALRCWQDDDDVSVTVDLGRPDGNMVHITPLGYDVVSPRFAETAHIKWRRTKGSEPLPEPEDGGTREDVAKVLGLDAQSKEFKLTYGWLVVSLLSKVKRPILWNVGVMGSGKSTKARTVLRLVDPRPELGAAPGGNSRDDLVVAAARYIPSYDNIGKVSPITSDTLCRMVTGFEFSRRGLYSDDEVVSSTIVRTAVATSVVTPYGLGPDALERIVFVDYERMDDKDRRTEAELEAEFKELRPRLLGALYEDVAGVLMFMSDARRAGHVLPRMADYAMALHALDVHADTEGPDGFAGTYFHHVRQTMADRAAADPLTAALLRLVPKPGNDWKGRPEDLFHQINVHRPAEAKDAWPKAANNMSSILKKQAEVFRAVGLVVRHYRGRLDDGKAGNVVELHNISGLVTEATLVDEDRAESLAEARAQADGYTAYCLALAQAAGGRADRFAKVPSCDVYADGESWLLARGGAVDLTRWDADARTYNGQAARDWFNVDNRFKG